MPGEGRCHFVPGAHWAQEPSQRLRVAPPAAWPAVSAGFRSGGAGHQWPWPGVQPLTPSTWDMPCRGCTHTDTRPWSGEELAGGDEELPGRLAAQGHVLGRPLGRAAPGSASVGPPCWSAQSSAALG